MGSELAHWDYLGNSPRKRGPLGPGWISRGVRIVGHRTMRILAIASVAALSATALGTTTADAEVCWKYRERERKLFKKINRARSSRGIVKLDKDPQLSKVARRR